MFLFAYAFFDWHLILCINSRSRNALNIILIRIQLHALRANVLWVIFDWRINISIAEDTSISSLTIHSTKQPNCLNNKTFLEKALESFSEKTWNYDENRRKIFELSCAGCFERNFPMMTLKKWSGAINNSIYCSMSFPSSHHRTFSTFPGLWMKISFALRAPQLNLLE